MTPLTEFEQRQSDIVLTPVPLAASAAETTPRDYHGRWTKHGDSGVEVVESDSPRDALLNLWEQQTASDPSPDFDQLVNWSDGFHRTLNHEESYALSEYTGEAYIPINRGMRHGMWSDPSDRYDAPTLNGFARSIEGTFDRGEPYDRPLYRGQKASPKSLGSTDVLLGYRVGDTYTDKGFGSWSAEADQAMYFSKSYPPDLAVNNGRPLNSVMTRMVPNGHKMIPGEAMEGEVIGAPGSGYRVTRIVDFVNPGTNERHRYMEVEEI